MRPKPTLLQIYFAFGVLACLLTGYYISRLAPGETQPSALLGVLKWPFLGAAVILYPLLRRLQRSLPRSQPPMAAESEAGGFTQPQRPLLLYAMAGLPALFGLTLVILGAPLRTLLLLSGLSLFYLAVLTPTDGE